MHIRSMHEWRDAKIKCLVSELAADPAREQSVKCAKCSGEGSVTDWGEITGQEFEADCDECDGDGLVPLDSSTLSESNKIFTFHEFTTELESDLKALARWTGVPAEVVLSQHGFRCWSDIENRSLRCILDNPSTFY